MLWERRKKKEGRREGEKKEWRREGKKEGDWKIRKEGERERGKENERRVEGRQGVSERERKRDSEWERDLKEGDREECEASFFSTWRAVGGMNLWKALHNSLGTGRDMVFHDSDSVPFPTGEVICPHGVDAQLPQFTLTSKHSSTLGESRVKQHLAFVALCDLHEPEHHHATKKASTAPDYPVHLPSGCLSFFRKFTKDWPHKPETSGASFVSLEWRTKKT